MTNKVKFVLYSFIGAVAGYSAHKLANTTENTAEKTMHQATQQGGATGGVTWVDFGDEGSPFDEPMFKVGDVVLLYSPYTAEFYAEEYSIVPNTYTIEDVAYDEEEEVFRYRLSGDYSHWYSEDWLSLPMFTKYTRLVDEFGDTGEERAKADELMVSKIMDGYARQQTTDRLLDKLREGTEEEKAEAKRQLQELMDKGEI